VAKLTITKEALVEASQQKQTAIALTLNTSGLSYREQADMLLALAQSIEAVAEAESGAEALRAKVVAKDPQFQTTTRLRIAAPEVITLRGPKGEERGIARLVEIEPPAPKVKRTKKRPGAKPASPALFPAPELEFSEDDDVEFQIAGRGEWRTGIVIDGGMGAYIIEDNYGRRHRILDRHVRNPLEW